MDTTRSRASHGLFLHFGAFFWNLHNRMNLNSTSLKQFFSLQILSLTGESSDFHHNIWTHNTIGRPKLLSQLVHRVSLKTVPNVSLMKSNQGVKVEEGM